jgi:predicted ATPase/class 3 adenylate cyclase/Tfp pilus assembly protein PilF
MLNPPTGTITFLFTDIEGSTRLWEQYPQQMQAAVERHDAILRHAIEANGGYVFKTVGDAFCAAFPTALDGLQAALDAQRAMQGEEWGEIGPLRVRVGLHTGTAQERESDYFGPALNRVARLMSAGHGGQILLSLATQELVRGHLPTHVELRDLGERRLKDLFRPEHVYHVVAPDLPSDFPPLKTLDARANNLPVQLTPLIGREKELAAVVALLRRLERRLVTLTGPGGTGKTRLALQLAADMLDEYETGVFFVNLAPITDPGLLSSVLAQTLGINETAGQPLLDSLKDYLREKHMLLVLDNFEQIVGAAPLISELLSSAPGLKVLVTSREVLRLRGEQEFSVPPLQLPDPRHLPSLEHLTQYEAVRLFIERAVAVKADFEVTNENAPAVAEICARLDGLPLAIELAAARIRLLPPQAMLTGLQTGFKLLTGGARDLPPRQQTLRAAIEWSYNLLDEDEKVLFRRLAVFVGGSTLQAIEAVCGGHGDGQLEVEILDGVESLVSKSVLGQEERAAGESRFLMLVTIHEYAIERLKESGEAEEIRRRHLHYCVSLAEEAAPNLVFSPSGIRWLERLEAEHDNMRAALGWALEVGEMEAGLRLAGALWEFWYFHSHLREGCQWLERMLGLEKNDPKPVTTFIRAKALNALGALLHPLGSFELAKEPLEESLALYRELGEKAWTAEVLNNLAIVTEGLGNIEQAIAYHNEALALRREIGAMRQRQSLYNLGTIAESQGDYDRAVALYEEAIALGSVVGEFGAPFPQLGLANIALQRRDLAGAESLFKESLVKFGKLQWKEQIGYILMRLAKVYFLQQQPERSARLCGAAEIALESIGVTGYKDDLASLRARLGSVTASRTAWQEGRAMSMEQAIAYALEGEEHD